MDFGNKRLSNVYMRVQSSKGGTLQIRTGKINGTLIAQAVVPSNNMWTVIKVPLTIFPKGLHDLFVIMSNGKQIEVDWLYFK